MLTELIAGVKDMRFQALMPDGVALAWYQEDRQHGLDERHVSQVHFGADASESMCPRDTHEIQRHRDIRHPYLEPIRYPWYVAPSPLPTFEWSTHLLSQSTSFHPTQRSRSTPRLRVGTLRAASRLPRQICPRSLEGPGRKRSTEMLLRMTALYRVARTIIM